MSSVRSANVFKLLSRVRLTRLLTILAVSRSVLVLSSGRAPRLKLINRLHRCMTARKKVLQAKTVGPRNVSLKPGAEVLGARVFRVVGELLCDIVVDICLSNLLVVPWAKARFSTCLGVILWPTSVTTCRATAKAPLELVLVIISMLLRVGVPTTVVRLMSGTKVSTFVLP